MFDSYISIDKNFKASVNLQFDLGNIDKVLQYVPTTDLCDVIKIYIKNVLFGGDFRSSFLAGPYGKGKSYLSLIITYLLSKREDKKLFKRVCCKFESIDKELASLLQELDSKNISLLPIIINNNASDDFNQNFMLALNNSLKNEGLQNSVIPVSSYSESLRLISQWEDTKNDGFNIFNECLRYVGVELADLKNKLQNYDTQAYQVFEKLFTCVSRGASFNPMVSNDIASVYEDVAYKLKPYGYSGLFIIFDEFGSFLENQTADFSTRLNKLQVLAEKCNSSSESVQMHLCCVTHKEVVLYQKGKTFADEFAKISGRFKSIRFDRTLDENYQLLCSTLIKKEGYKELVQSSLEEYNDFVLRLSKTNAFYDSKQLSYILENGFPFNPLSLFALIRISELIGQNERTLFTFISDTDISGFKSFIANNQKGFLNVPKIYDYFEGIIKDNAEYKEYYLKVQALQTVLIKDIERDIVKALAIVKIINDNIKLSSSIEAISLCLAESYENIQAIVEHLVSQNYLKINTNDNTLDFSLVSDKSLNEMLDNVILRNYHTSNLPSILSNIDKRQYFVSNRYNYENAMTRFCHSVYMYSSTFLSLSSLSSVLEETFADGYIINLIVDSPITQNEILNVLKKNKENIIVRLSNSPFEEITIKKAKYIFAAQHLLKTDKSISQTSKNTLLLMVEDSISELNEFLFNYYKNSDLIGLHGSKQGNLQQYIYDVFTSYYSKTVIFNNELLNKNIISPVIARSRNIVLDSILKGTEYSFGETSAEATILSSLNLAIKNNPTILPIINEFFVNSNGRKKPIQELILKLRNAPYGMRDGAIPLFIAHSIHNLSIEKADARHTILLYNKTVEIELNASNLCKCIEEKKDGERFQIKYESLNVEKIQAIEETENYLCLFNTEQSYQDRIKIISKSLRNKILNLPSVVIKSNDNDNVLNLNKSALKFKEIFLKVDINPYDTFFYVLESLFCCSPNKFAAKIEEIFNEYKQKYQQYQMFVARVVTKKFVDSEGSLRASYELWASKYRYLGSMLFEPTDKAIYNTLKQIQYDNFTAINTLSHAVLHCTIADWNKQKEQLFFKAIEHFILAVQEYKGDTKTKKDAYLEDENADLQLSALGETLYTNLLDSVEEYGSALSVEEKAKILKKILRDIVL